jgi:hypothetical protein
MNERTRKLRAYIGERERERGLNTRIVRTEGAMIRKDVGREYEFLWMG